MQSPKTKSNLAAASIIFAVVSGISLVSCFGAVNGAPVKVGDALTLFTCATGALAFWIGLVAVTRAKLRKVDDASRTVGFAMLAGAVTSFLGFLGYAALHFHRGRQLRSFGRALLPKVHASEDWSSLRVDLDRREMDPSICTEIASRWRENGQTEHASVAAFAELTSDLLALGAPPSLVASAQRDALDEIRHAEICFAIARAFDGEAQSPAPFAAARRQRLPLSPSRQRALCTLAVDSLVDGALNEGASARVLVQIAGRCEDPGLRALIKTIAADEGRHAAHGWDVVEWCITEGGAPVLRAVQRASTAFPSVAVLAATPETISRESYGLPDARTLDEAYTRVRTNLQKRVARLGLHDETRAHAA